MPAKVPVYVETGTKRTFASAIDWPGWSRGGRTEEEALAALVTYAPRFAQVARRARLPFSAPRDVSDLKMTQRLRGNASTDFGVPAVEAAADRQPINETELERQLALLKASWSTLDHVATSAEGVELRKGPRGGGRDLDKILDHVIEAEEAYLGQLGARPPKVSGERDARTTKLRAAILEALSAIVEGRPFAEPRRTKKPWSARYFVRRTAWHALDHAWEIVDRSTASEGRR